MKKISKIMVILSVFALVLSLNTYASQKTYLVVNGEYIKTDADPFIESGRTLVPVRFISENLDSIVDWFKEEKKVVITTKKEGTEIKKVELIIGSDIAKLYDKDENVKEEKLDAAAKIVNGRTFIPVRFISESLGTEVGWDKENRVVLIGDASKYDAKKFKEEVIGKAAPAKKEEKKEQKKEQKKETKAGDIKFEGKYLNACNGLTLNIEKLTEPFPDAPDIKYVGAVGELNLETSVMENIGLVFFKFSKDGKTVTASTYDESDKEVTYPVKIEKKRFSFVNCYWYKLYEGDKYEIIDGKFCMNGKEVPIEPGK